MEYEEKEQAALSAMAASLKRMLGLGSANPLAQRRNVEAVYGQAYQELVRMGLKPQLKLKYRRG